MALLIFKRGRYLSKGEECPPAQIAFEICFPLNHGVCYKAQPDKMGMAICHCIHGQQCVLCTRQIKSWHDIALSSILKVAIWILRITAHLWRNWLARSAVNRKVAGSSPARCACFFFSPSFIFFISSFSPLFLFLLFPLFFYFFFFPSFLLLFPLFFYFLNLFFFPSFIVFSPSIFPPLLFSSFPLLPFFPYSLFFHFLSIPLLSF